jgi:hypothetical protein
MEEMLGSYAPGQNNEKKFPLEEAPSGMLARGKYEARSRFTDDDGHSYLDFTWSFEVNYLVSETYFVRLRRIGISCNAIDGSGDAF